MSDAPPHPREVFDYLGDGAPERAFVDAQIRGRLHHAWLLTGPEGIGKATFAYRVARRLLGARPRAEFGVLGAGPDDPVSRQIIARAHPDLLALQRDPEDGKTRRGIPVDEARGLPDFFAKTSATSPYRVAIIDTADDLNVNAANAVLKTLEEPPERGVLLLISHAPGALLPTIRSRCRRLRFDPPETASAAAWVAQKAGVGPTDAERLLGMARQAPGRAWRLATEGALEMDRAAVEVLNRLPKTDDVAILALADSFRGPSGAARFGLFFDRLAAQIHAMSVSADMTGPRAAAWAEIWSDLVACPDRPRR